MTDLDALREQALAGDGAALNRLCAALEAPVYRLCLRMLGDPRDAEDAAQDVLVKVITHLSRFEGRSALTTWVHTVTVRHVLGLRRSRAETRVSGEAGFAERLDEGLRFGGGAEDSDPVLLREIRLACTQGLLLVLSREERLAVILVDLLGFDGPEAAAVAGVSPDALRQRLARARSRLGTFLRTRCGVATPDAACSCARQGPAKRALGLTAEQVRFSPLFEPNAGEGPAPAVAAAADELRDLRTVWKIYDRDGAAPPTLGERIRAALPTVLG